MHYCVWLLVVAKADEARMPEVTVRRPLCEGDAGHELRLQPVAFFHRLRRQRETAPGILGFGKISEWASVTRERWQPPGYVRPCLRSEAVADLRDA